MKKISSTLLLLCTIFITSCGNIKRIEAKESSDYYFYSIGEGQTVYVKNNSLSENAEISDYLDKIANDSNTVFSIKSIVTDSGVQVDENILKIDSNNLRTLSITCLNSFDEVIRIEKIIYMSGKVQFDINYNIELQFNSDFEYLPSFPTNYLSADNLGVNNATSDLILDQKNKIFYINFNKRALCIEKEIEFIINQVSFNNSLVEMLDIDYAIIPDNFYYKFQYSDLEYNDLSESLDLLKLEYGAILKINFNIVSEEIKSFGCDLNFDIGFNGDNYCVPYNVYYSSKNM